MVYPIYSYFTQDLIGNCFMEGFESNKRNIEIDTTSAFIDEVIEIDGFTNINLTNSNYSFEYIHHNNPIITRNKKDILKGKSIPRFSNGQNPFFEIIE